MKISKNKEITLQTHLCELKNQEYAKSFQRANKDKEMIKISEEGIKDYLEMLKG